MCCFWMSTTKDNLSIGKEKSCEWVDIDRLETELEIDLDLDLDIRSTYLGVE